MRQEVTVSAGNLYKLVVEPSGNADLAQCPPHETALRDKNPDIIHGGAIFDDPSGRMFAQELLLPDRAVPGSRRSQKRRHPRQEVRSGCGKLFTCSSRSARTLVPGGSVSSTSAKPFAEELPVADGDLPPFQPGTCRAFQSGFDDDEGKIHEQDRTGDADGIDCRITDRGIAVAHRSKGGLQGRGAGSRSGEKPQGITRFQPEEIDEEQRQRSGNHKRKEAQQVGFLPVRPDEAGEKFFSVLYPDRVEKQRQPQGSHQRRRGGGGASHPTNRATNKTAPEPREKPFISTSPSR